MLCGKVTALLCFSVLILLPAGQGEESELLLVHALFRHGARTTYETYPNDPYINNTYYPFGWGSLTNEGKMMAYNLGQFLRNHYNNFLGEDYSDNEVYARSSDELRTKTSALLVLAGLFPPSQRLTWNRNLVWQPIPVAYKAAEQEDLFHQMPCSYRDKLYEDLPSDPDAYEKFIKPYLSVYEKLTNYTGKQINDPRAVHDLYLILCTQDEMNYTLPEWTKEVYPEPMHTLGALAYEYMNFDIEALKINTGYVLRYILNNCQEKVSGQLEPPQRKIILLSGHETTIGFVLHVLLNETQTRIPEYSSALVFELHRIKEDHFLKVRYKNGTFATKFTDIQVPGCNMLCPLEQFVTLYEWALPLIPIEDACRMNANDIDNKEYTNESLD